MDSFLLTALSNFRDRLTLLKLEKELTDFINDSKRQRIDFPAMSAYQRLIVHRVASYFHLDHIVQEKEPGKRSIILFKTNQSKM